VKNREGKPKISSKIFKKICRIKKRQYLCALKIQLGSIQADSEAEIK
jgi:hypothetical protein